MWASTVRVVLLASLLVGCAGNRTTNVPQRDLGPRSESGLIWADLVRGGDGKTSSGDARPVAERPVAKIDQAKPKPDLSPPKPDQPNPCSGGCDDGNPCTTDACTASGCSHAPLGQVIHRYYHQGTGAHAYALAGAQPSGFNAEAPYFRTLTAAGGSAVAIQQQAASNGDFMLSLDAGEGVACCGYTNFSQIGYGFAGSVTGTMPLYRLYHSGSGLHLSSTDPNEGTQVGYQLEGVTVHVCPP